MANKLADEKIFFNHFVSFCISDIQAAMDSGMGLPQNGNPSKPHESAVRLGVSEGVLWGSAFI